MADWLLITAGSIIGTIILGTLSSALWELVRDTISIPSTKYINMRGGWTIASSYELDGSLYDYKERMVIKQQLGRRFRGTIFSPYPTTNPEEVIELDVRGEFKDKFHVLFWYDHRTARLTDVGSGVFQINPDHITAEGGSVNFGVSSPKKPVIIRFSMSKLR